MNINSLEVIELYLRQKLMKIRSYLFFILMEKVQILLTRLIIIHSRLNLLNLLNLHLLIILIRYLLLIHSHLILIIIYLHSMNHSILNWILILILILIILTLTLIITLILIFILTILPLIIMEFRLQLRLEHLKSLLMWEDYFVGLSLNFHLLRMLA